MTAKDALVNLRFTLLDYLFLRTVGKPSWYLNGFRAGAGMLALSA